MTAELLPGLEALSTYEAPLPRRANVHARERRVASRADHDHDFFPTPPSMTQALLDRESFPGIVWEPACGDGAMSNVIRDAGYFTFSTDLIDRGYGDGGVDFLKATELPKLTRQRVESIITNPPFALATQFLRHSLALGARKVALLCRVAFLAGQDRREVLEQHLSRVWIFSKRHTLWAKGQEPERKPGEKKKTGSIEYAWFVFERGQTGGKIGWIP